MYLRIVLYTYIYISEVGTCGESVPTVFSDRCQVQKYVVSEANSLKTKWDVDGMTMTSHLLGFLGRHFLWVDFLPALHAHTLCSYIFLLLVFH